MGKALDKLKDELEDEAEDGWTSVVSHHAPNHKIATLERKVAALMADFTALEAAVSQVQTDDNAAAAELASLAETIKGLSAGQTIPQETIDKLTADLTGATQKLTSAATAAQPAPAATTTAAPAPTTTPDLPTPSTEVAPASPADPNAPAAATAPPADPSATPVADAAQAGAAATPGV